MTLLISPSACWMLEGHASLESRSWSASGARGQEGRVPSCREWTSSSLEQCLARCAYTGFWKSPYPRDRGGTCLDQLLLLLVPTEVTTVHIAQELLT